MGTTQVQLSSLAWLTVCRIAVRNVPTDALHHPCKHCADEFGLRPFLISEAPLKRRTSALKQQQHHLRLTGQPSGNGEKMQLQDEDFEALKKNFDHICDKYDLRSEEKSSLIADFLTDQTSRNFDTKAVSEKFGMSMRDANTFLMWIQVGTNFKREVLDKNAELARQGLI